MFLSGPNSSLLTGQIPIGGSISSLTATYSGALWVAIILSLMSTLTYTQVKDKVVVPALVVTWGGGGRGRGGQDSGSQEIHNGLIVADEITILIIVGKS